ncbi:MAG: aldehyde dehydrogenase family protein [Actinomycetota bacterium]|nr:aldehyde dehydrogenase family protein [Actinomycetota bacterium]
MPHAPEQLDLIAGARRRPELKSGAMLCNPDTGEVLAEGLASSATAVDEALAAADEVHRSGVWNRLPLAERVARLHALADAVAAIAPGLAEPEALNTGIPIDVAGPMTGGLGGYFHGAAHFLQTQGEVEDRAGRHGRVQLHRAPRGPAVVIAPWNAPAPCTIGRTAMALGAGCPVIVKPSEWAPFTADLFMEAMAAADLPPGLVQLVHGGADVGAQLVADPRTRVVSFTGGLQAGRAIAAAAAPNFAALQLELGGNNPAIVRADANIASAAAGLAAGMTKLNGQWCEAPGKILVHRSLADELVARLLDELEQRSFGSCLQPGTAIGPMSHRARRDELVGRIAELVSAGATAHQVHRLPALRGWFVAPTVLTGLPSAAAVSEIFGPVVTVHAFDADDEAVAAANEAGDGLAGFVFSADVDAALAMGAQLRGGEVRINGTGLFDLCDGSTQSFWGTSGFGAHGDVQVFELFRGSRIVGEDDPGAPM